MDTQYKLCVLDRGECRLDYSALEEYGYTVNVFETSTPEETLERLVDVDIVITNKVEINDELMNAAKKLKLICVAATGVNNVDLSAARRRKISVSNVPGYSTQSVADLTLTFLLALNCNLLSYQKLIREKKWQNADFFSLPRFSFSDLNTRTLGLIGLGSIGSQVQKMAQALGVHVLVAKRDSNDTREGRVDFIEVLRRSDYVSLHCPLMENTKLLMNRKSIAQMKKGACLINTSRGGLLDEEAVAEAIKSGHLGGIAVDVLSTEPPSSDNPLLLLSQPNVIITPHIAWASNESQKRLLNELVENIHAFTQGIPRNRVD
jgi:glycerate dehydrogenase